MTKVFLFRGLPGAPAYETACALLERRLDAVINLMDYAQTQQGNLFVTEGLTEEARSDIEAALKGPTSRLAICGILHMAWFSKVVEDVTEGYDVEVYRLVVEGSERPMNVPKKHYERLKDTFEIKL